MTSQDRAAAAWAALDERQQAYTRVIYDADQAAEQRAKARGWKDIARLVSLREKTPGSAGDYVPPPGGHGGDTICEYPKQPSGRELSPTSGEDRSSCGTSYIRVRAYACSASRTNAAPAASSYMAA
ncbi:hypothetical protein [Streptosporangium roseum]|uniref:hypothetical protein n=1 Tax=Streptosporangium roseum TaxID=2001 RepID=UPI0005BCA4DC|nr:hypothetical protein [Streptosporangium roseum]